MVISAEKIRMKWDIFTYNYGWAGWVPYVDGWIPKFSLFFPIVGYLILFNDTVSESLVFSHLTGTEQQWGFSGSERLRFLYFGLLFLGVSNFIYRVRRPHTFRFGVSLVEYTRTGLEFFTYGDFLKMHGRIREAGHISPEGKYYDSEWEGFSDAANNTDEGRDSVKRDGSWDEAKKSYGGLLRSILRESFYHGDRQRRWWLSTCLILSTIGYLLLVAPGADLFIKVVMSTLNVIG